MSRRRLRTETLRTGMVREALPAVAGSRRPLVRRTTSRASDPEVFLSRMHSGAEGQGLLSAPLLSLVEERDSGAQTAVSRRRRTLLGGCQSGRGNGLLGLEQRAFVPWVRLPYGRSEVREGSSFCLGAARWSDPRGTGDRPPLPESCLREPRPLRAGHTTREQDARGGYRCEERRQDALHPRAPSERRQPQAHGRASSVPSMLVEDSTRTLSPSGKMT